MDYSDERNKHPKPVDMTISSKVPKKWRFVDLETGDVWRWDETKGCFTRAKDYPNAHLIKASYKMRRALKLVKGYQGEGDIVIPSEVWKEIDIALAEAEGKQ